MIAPAQNPHLVTDGVVCAPLVSLADQLNKQKFYFSAILAPLFAPYFLRSNYSEHTSVAPMLLVFFFSSLGNAITLPIWHLLSPS